MEQTYGIITETNARLRNPAALRVAPNALGVARRRIYDKSLRSEIQSFILIFPNLFTWKSTKMLDAAAALGCPKAKLSA